MPMIPKPMTDINSESAYEKLKFVEEHYNDLMAAYTDIMEHLKLPVMTDTGGGGSGEDCLHEVVEVTNPCPAYVQFDLNISNDNVGFQYTYKDNWGDYSTGYIVMRNSNENSVAASIVDALRKYNREHPNDTINLNKYSSDRLGIFPKPTDEHSNLVYTVILLDKTTGEPVENMDENYGFDGYEEVTYDIVSEMYDIKLALTEDGSYAYEPIILGDFYEKLVELRNSINTSNPLSKLPTPEELLRILQVRCNNYSPTDIDAKLDIALLTPEERARVRSNLHMNTSNSIPGDTEYMYAINLFCHPNTLNDYHRVSFNCMGGYSKGFIGFNVKGLYGLLSNGCGDSGSATYRRISLNLTPVLYSGSYEYFILPESYSTDNDTYSEANAGITVTPYTFKLIQSKEGIDRRL